MARGWWCVYARCTSLGLVRAVLRERDMFVVELRKGFFLGADAGTLSSAAISAEWRPDECETQWMEGISGSSGNAARGDECADDECAGGG
jgi:hypothetical protein